MKSNRFKTNKNVKTSKEIYKPMSRFAQEKTDDQSLLASVKEDVEFLTKTNVLVEQGLSGLKALLVLAPTAVFAPLIEKGIVHLAKIALNLKPMKDLASVVKASKNAKGLVQVAKNLREVRQTMGPLFMILNTFFVGFSIYEIQSKIKELNALKNKKDTGDEFYTVEERRNKLNSEIQFEIMRLVSSLASFVPVAGRVVAIADALMLVFDPQHVTDWGFMAEGFKGGEAEAKRVWELSTAKGRTREENLSMGELEATMATGQLKIDDQRIKKMLQETNASLIIDMKSLPVDQIRKFGVNAYIAKIQEKNNPANKNIFNQWLNRPESQILINESLLIVKTALRNFRRQQESKTSTSTEEKPDIQSLKNKIDFWENKIKTTKSPTVIKFYEREIENLLQQLSKAMGAE